MLYKMRNIVTHSEEVPLPTCMYRLKNINDLQLTNEQSNEPDLKIKEQVIKFLKAPCKKMAELELRQEHLLQQLDKLHERIKSLSFLCDAKPSTSSPAHQVTKPQIAEPAEIIINASADHLPYYLIILIKGGLKNKITFAYHIHSSVPGESVVKIKEFMKLLNLNTVAGPVSVKLIFKEVGANTEMKLSSATSVAPVGEVNVLRYLALVFPAAAPHEESLLAESLLDEVYLLQRARGPGLADKPLRSLFHSDHYKGDWILGRQMTIVDIAAFSAIKQLKTISPKLIQAVPKPWFEKLDSLLK